MAAGRYVVIETDADTGRVAIVSGMGRNRGTWDADHGRRRAQHYARQLRAEKPRNTYAVSEA